MTIVATVVALLVICALHSIYLFRYNITLRRQLAVQERILYEQDKAIVGLATKQYSVKEMQLAQERAADRLHKFSTHGAAGLKRGEDN